MRGECNFSAIKRMKNAIQVKEKTWEIKIKESY